MTKPLILSRRFAPLFATQFLAAFSDNFLKSSLAFFVLATLGAQQGASVVTAAGAVFIAPFLLFSVLGGQIADKNDKATVARWLKLGEIAAAVFAGAGIVFGSIPLMMVALFLFGTGSALFGPIKYGILPDHLATEELPRANAWIEGATFVAIIAGSVVAGISAAFGGGHPLVFGSIIVGVSVLCYGSSLLIPRTNAADPSVRIEWNVVRSTVSIIREMAGDKRIFTTSLIVSWFWLVGAVVMSVLPTAVRGIGGSELASTIYLCVFAVSVAAGSAIAAWFASGRIVLLPAVFGSAFAGLFLVDLGMALSASAASDAVLPLADFFGSFGNVRIGFDLAMIAFFGAFMAVPTFAALQAWAPPARRARIVSGNNVLNALFMAAGAGFVAVLQAVGTSVGTVSMLLGAASVAAAVVMLVKLPTSPFLDFISVLFRAFHRLEIEGLENLDKAGATPIFALNHVSFLDAPLAMAFTDRKPIFAINTEIAKKAWIRPFLKLCNAFPLDPTKPIATRHLIRQVEAGNPLVIFPEGRIATVTGTMMKVYDGAAMVADKTGAKIVPVRIDGLEKSPFSRLNAMQIRKRLFPKVKVTIMPPVELSLDPELKGRGRRQAAGAELHRIMTDMMFRTSFKTGTILEEVISAAKEFGEKKVAVTDYVGGSVNTLTYRRILIGTRVLAKRLKTMLPERADGAGIPVDRNVGVMLPNANGTVVTFLALISAGKVPAMINFSAGLPALRKSCTAAKVTTILTTRTFVSLAKLVETVAGLEEHGVRFVYVDEIRETVTLAEKLAAAVMRHRPLVKRSADDEAVVLFTSGSSGSPKGVAHTHASILANAAQASSSVDFGMNDRVFNALPMFHSFGLGAATILPLTSGVPVNLYPSPLHYRIIPELIYASNATITFATNSFAAGYARSAHAGDLRSIRLMFVGAEALKQQTRETYMNKFGIRLLEGFGVTEAAPVVAINTPLYNRPGTVGKLVPGLEARLEDVEGIPLGGKLLIRGPNIMKGYYRFEQPGVLQAPPEGWHDTGDVVTIDEDGFVKIVDRAERFANIAGEKVSMRPVEDCAAELWPSVPSVAVRLPDARKGEKIVLLTERENATRAEFVAFAKTWGLPELVFPSEIVIGKVPLLGAGKVDFISATRYVTELETADAA